MDTKKLINLITTNFDNTQNKLIESTTKDMITLLNMAETIVLINECVNNKDFVQKVKEKQLSQSLEYYLDQVIISCLDIKSSIEAIEIATNLLKQIIKEENKK